MKGKTMIEKPNRQTGNKSLTESHYRGPSLMPVIPLHFISRFKTSSAQKKKLGLIGVWGGLKKNSMCLFFVGLIIWGARNCFVPGQLNFFFHVRSDGGERLNVDIEV